MGRAEGVPEDETHPYRKKKNHSNTDDQTTRFEKGVLTMRFRTLLAGFFIFSLAMEPSLFAQQMEHRHTHERALPSLAGQDTFAAIQEIVTLLEADPSTDWAKVDIKALREHLIDMNALMLNSEVVEDSIPGGLEIIVGGLARSGEAVRRMVPPHSQMLNQIKGWNARSELLPDGRIRLTVTADKTDEVRHIRGLGFLGLMVKGAHHQSHHLSIARGEPMH